MKRNEHLQWAKDRALKEDISLMMWASFLSDMAKHDELKDHIALDLWVTIDMNDKDAVKKFIEGFN